MAGNLHFDAYCKGCKRRVGGCRCMGPKDIRWVEKDTCMYCRFEDQNDLLDRKLKKSRNTKNSK